jgi:hypothetical protein
MVASFSDHLCCLATTFSEQQALHVCPDAVSLGEAKKNYGGLRMSIYSLLLTNSHGIIV